MKGKGCCVWNDRIGGVRNGREGVLRSGWQDLGRVVSSEGRNLRSVNGGCAMSLDSSLCFGMTEGGACRFE